MSFYAFILRDKRIKLKRKNKQQQNRRLEQLETPKRNTAQNTRHRPATKLRRKTTSYGNYYSKTNQQKKKRKKNKTRIKKQL